MKEVITSSNRNLLGIDIGGSNVKVIFDSADATLKYSYPTGDDFTVKDLEKLLESVCDSLPNTPDSIGIAFSGITKDGKSVYKSPLPCLPDGFSADILKKFSRSIAFINDANAAAICGLYENPHSKVLAAITCGSGIGLGIMINGKLFTGSNGAAGEIHGNFIGSSTNPYKVGNLASGRNLKRKIDSSTFAESVCEAGTYLGILMTHVVNCFNPDTIYLSGGCLNFDGYLKSAEAFLRNNGYDSLTRDLQIVCAKDLSYSGAIGAAKFNYYI